MFVFDVYGTLWNIQAIEEAVSEVAGTARSGEVLGLWRQKQLEYAYLRTLMDRYVPFSEITRQALVYALSVCDLKISNEEYDRLLTAWHRPTPYRDAEPLLQKLSPDRRVVLSNGDPEMLDAGMRHTGWARYFEAVLSVDRVRRYKPHPSVYQLVGEVTGAKPEEVVFVSANGWDAAGAAHFGFRVIWVNRRNAPLEELSIKPWKTVSALGGITV